MSPLTSKRIRELVQALTKHGVRFPEQYPPANLDPGKAQFRGVWAEVETVALLAQVVDPETLELVEHDKGGDTDIMIHLSPPYRLQVKGPLPTNVHEDLGIYEMVRSARRDAVRRFQVEQPTPWKGVFSIIRIHLGKGGEEHSGISWSVDHPDRVHVAVVEIEGEVLATMADKNLERWTREAVGQLVHYEDALLVPVLNIGRYSLNQAQAYHRVKEIFRRHPRWRNKVSGVLLILRGYGEQDSVTGFHRSNLRLVGVENPLAPEDRRLRPEMFNPDIQDETIYQENMVVVSTEPSFVPRRIENRLVWVGDTLFGALPGPLGEPFAFRP